MSELSKSLVDGIKYIVDDSIKKAPFDITRSGVITQINNDNSYTVVVDGVEYTNTRVFNHCTFSMNEIVSVVFPQNNAVKRYILGGISIFSNANLLDNWYFGNPVNQRKIVDGGTGQHYWNNREIGLDRWKRIGTRAGTPPISILDGYIRIPIDTELIQKIEPKTIQLLEGLTVTASFLTNNGKIFFGSDVVQNGEAVFVTEQQNPMLYLFDGSIYLTAYYLIDLVAIKLEIGSQQTLAHYDSNANKFVLNEIPNYNTQLKNCQRYYQTLYKEGLYNTFFNYSINNAGNTISFQIPISIRDSSNYKLTMIGTLYLKGATGLLKTITINIYEDDGTSGEYEIYQNDPYVVITIPESATGGVSGVALADDFVFNISADL